MAERAHTWTDGTELWWRGERVTLRVHGDGRHVTCGDQLIAVPIDAVVDDEVTNLPRRLGVTQPSLFDPPATRDLRTIVEAHFRQVATRELPPRCHQLAALHNVHVARVFVRNQRSRWGACSSTGTITLNWRLLQLPPWVSDYVIFHELMHRRQPNHSMRFWREVASVCPRWREAERWIKKNGRTIL